MANSNTIQLTLKVKDDGSVVIDQAAGKIEQFGKKNQTAAHTSASAWQKVKSAWLEIIGTIYAMQKAWDYMDMAAKAEQAEVAFRNITQSVGVNADTMIEKMREASRNTIDDSHLMQKALKAIAQDVDPNKIPQLFDAARVGAVKAGEDIGDVADQIIDAIANEMPRGLRKFGLITKEQMSLFNKAVAGGAENLNLLDLVIANAELQEAKLALQTSSSAIAMQQFKAQCDEIKETIGGWLLTGLQKLLGLLQWVAAGASMAAAGFVALGAGVNFALAAINEKLGRTDAAKRFRAEAEEMKKIADAWSGSADELMAKAMGNLTGQVEDASGKTKGDWKKQQADAQKRIDAWMAQAKAAAEAAKKSQELENAIKKITEAPRQSRENIVGIQQGSYAKEMLTIQNEVAEYRKAGVSKTKIEEFVAARIAEIRAAAAKKIQDDTQSSLENITGLQEGAQAQEMAALDRKVEEYRKEGATEIDIANYVAARKREIGLSVSKERLDAERDLYKDLRGYSGEYFEATVKLIDEQARKYRALGIDEAAVAAWVKEETINAYIEMGEKSDDWVAGVEAGLLRIKKEAMTTGKAMSEMVAEFANQSSNTLSTMLFDRWKGQTKSFKEYWTSFIDSLAKKWFDVSSQKFVDDMMIKLQGWLSNKTNPAGQNKSSGGFMGWLGSLLGGGSKSPASIANASAYTITTTGNIYINGVVAGGAGIPGAGAPTGPGPTTEGTGGKTESWLSSLWSKFTDFFSSLFNKIQGLFSSLSGWLSQLFSSLSSGLSSLLGSMGSMFGGGGGGGRGILGGLMGGLGGLFGGGGSAAMAGGAGSMFGGLPFMAALGFAEGGWIPEPVLGRGLSTGRYYSFAEREPERVMTQRDLRTINTGADRGASQGITVFNRFNIVSPNPNSFRKSEGQIMTDFNRAMSRSRRYE